MVTYFNLYTKLKVILQRNNEAVFLKTQNLNFSLVAGSIGFVFRFILLQVRFQICCYLWGPRGQEAGGRESSYTYLFS